MSEAIPGIPPPEAPKVRDAAVVILFRKAQAGIEVFWIRRGSGLAFAPGYYAFPGGSVDPDDARIEVAGLDGQQAMLRVAATRELFEEAGVLLADAPAVLTQEKLKQWRTELLDREIIFSELVRREKLRLRDGSLREAGRWITPPSMPKRFDTYFFLEEARANEQAEISAGESSDGGWVRPADALKMWQLGKALLHPPGLLALQVLADFQTIERAQASMQSPPNCPGHIATRIEFQQGIRLFPLETPTLPPATHTNAYVLGNGELLVVDPGASAVRQYARLLALIEGLKSEGKRPKAVVLTHHHADHIGGAEAVSQRLGIPIWCHELTAQRLPTRASRLLTDGEVISLAGLPTMRFRVLHTPGHARGHLCLVDEASSAAIVGDMVAGVGTIVIDPPEGDMTNYLAQLRRLKDYPVGSIYPAHGPVIADGPAKLEEYLSHREQREKRVLDALEPSGSTLQALVAKAYTDVPEVMHPVAERSTQAILIKLAREGKIVRKEERYFPSPLA